MERTASEVLTIEELSDYLKIPKSTLYNLVRKGSVPCQKVGKHWRFHKYAIDRWLQQQRKDANKKGARDR